jgi:hypothetical protein
MNSLCDFCKNKNTRFCTNCTHDNLKSKESHYDYNKEQPNAKENKKD